MKHLFFASTFEAQPFIAEGMKKISDSPEVFEGNYRVIIIGIGLIQAACNTTTYIHNHQITDNDELINLGIAGSTENHSIGEIIQVGKLKVFSAEEIPESSQKIWQQAYPEFQTKHSEVTLGSSLHPVWGNKFLPVLKKMDISLIDMEAYSFAQACRQFSLPHTIYKSVSDNLQKKSQKDFLANAQVAINTLYDFFLELE